MVVRMTGDPHATRERLGTKIVVEWRAPRDLSVDEAAEVHREMCLAATEAFRVMESRR